MVGYAIDIPNEEAHPVWFDETSAGPRSGHVHVRDESGRSPGVRLSSRDTTRPIRQATATTIVRRKKDD